MKTNARGMLLVCSAIGILACSQDGLTDPSSALASASQLVQEARSARPTGGICGTAFTFVPPTPGQPANVAVIRIALECRLAHLGRSTGEIVETIVTSEDGLTSRLTGTIVYVAANGDELHASFTGAGANDFVAGVVSFIGTEVYTGGTGRFAGASGASELTGTAALATLTGTYSLTSGSATY